MRVSIRAMRVHRELSTTEASKKIGVAECTIRNWESGRTAPNTAQITRLMQAYNCSLDDIILPQKLAKS